MEESIYLPEDINEQPVEVELTKKIREIKKFESEEELMKQIKKDIQNV